MFQDHVIEHVAAAVLHGNARFFHDVVDRFDIAFFAFRQRIVQRADKRKTLVRQKPVHEMRGRNEKLLDAVPLLKTQRHDFLDLFLDFTFFQRFCQEKGIIVFLFKGDQLGAEFQRLRKLQPADVVFYLQKPRKRLQKVEIFLQLRKIDLVGKLVADIFKSGILYDIERGVHFVFVPYRLHEIIA